MILNVNSRDANINIQKIGRFSKLHATSVAQNLPEIGRLLNFGVKMDTNREGWHLWLNLDKGPLYFPHLKSWKPCSSKYMIIQKYFNLIAPIYHFIQIHPCRGSLVLISYFITYKMGFSFQQHDF